MIVWIQSYLHHQRGASGPSSTVTAAHTRSMNKKRAAATVVSDREIDDLEEMMESFESPVIGTIVKIDEVESITPNSVSDTSHTGEPYTTPVTLTNVTSEEVNTQVTTAEVTNIPFLTPTRNN